MKTKRARRKQHKRGDARRKSRTLRPRTLDDFFALPEEAQTDWEKTLRVIAMMRTDGLSLKKAAKKAGVSPRTVALLGRQALRKRSNGSYYATKRDSLLRVMKVLKAKGPVEIAIRNSHHASTLGQYWDAVHKYVEIGDPSEIAVHNGKKIKDANGTEVPLLTDLSELGRLASAGVLSFESLYGRTE